MVIYYDLETKEIKRTEDNTIEPVLPLNMDLEKKIKHYKNEGEGVICLPYEMGIHIFDYELCFNESGQFTGLQPKQISNE
ncbi:hypothetical protein HAHI6034_05815 [Hathewaya histolytica]|uniref:Uncharacterized protein n=1 Tax=Hathewaya histolytica TaxID=1498 RepID=A0A4U9RD46_HATHI|nr:hypothetical protein [Hathewaya histolytica]VTQ89672.1 Uncharacterised protein [Hathewaya histolytica]